MNTLLETITVEQFADRLQIPTRQAYDFIQRNLPPSCKTKLGTRVRILVEPFNEWLRQGGSDPRTS